VSKPENETQKSNPEIKPAKHQVKNQNQTDESSRGKSFEISRSPNISVPDRPK